MHTFLSTIVTVAFVVLIVMAFWKLSTTAQKVHDTLKGFRKEAEATNDLSKLQDINSRLVDYANKECWHRHLATHATEVNAYIVGKYEALKSVIKK